MLNNMNEIYGYDYFGYSINEVEKWVETDRLLREFILKNKKSKNKIKEKPRNPIGFK
jgi:hypothetical protein